MKIVTILQIVLIILAIMFLNFFIKDCKESKKQKKFKKKTNPILLATIGFFINFFDTLGIGGFAPLTAILKQFKLVNDRIISGTLNTAMCIPIILEALIFIKVVEVETTTLLSMVIASMVGAVFGSRIVVKIKKETVQFGMSIALFFVAFLILAGKLNLTPVGGTAVGLTGVKLGIAIIGNFILGALMTLGIGLYAPCMALVYSLGLSPIVAFPIMMASCAYLMPIACIKFIKSNAYSRQVTLYSTLFGISGVLVAAFFVKTININLLTWLVFIVIIYTAIKLLKDSNKKLKVVTFLEKLKSEVLFFTKL